ncbi:hypothetical protein GCT13_25505 [Paraburkholderia sp. CNPSo 3157]|uniref:TnsA endonuclease N-terminal domain-containing protein n=1 Tax=Paraburkholderia franconis TaxID=2654983 RepID=A0A7X1NET8_9BURK|nr:hypothetical protein [Paraburkholderia franconis]MPW20153.1 hypothetical protein [Paraburkholderia franconis]
MPTNRKRSCSEIRNDMISEWQIAQPRRVRRIVTRSGRGVRGVFPSRKAAKPAEFESLAEEMALLVLEIATSITHIETQPTVFEFCDSDASRRYTPDIATRSAVGTTYFEVKYDKALTSDGDTVARLRRAVDHLRSEGHVLRFLLESELAASHLLNEIRELLRARPPRGRYRSNIDPTLWDPERGTSPGPAMLERWQSAQRQCDELLARVMRRDPDDLLPAEQR